jgi:tryptophan halogenase
MSARRTRVVIVGRDAALWLTACALANALSATGVSVTAIELPSRLGPASAYVAWPAIEALHAKLGIDEAELLRATGGGFSLGFNIVPPGMPPFFLAHGAYGAPIDGGDFFGHWLRARAFGLDAAFEDFSPTAMAARHGRVLLPDAETETFGRTDYGYHLPAIAYAALLKGLAHRRGVTIRQAVSATADRDGESGDIRAIACDGGEAVAGDLFVDASGEEAVLSGGDVEDWRGFFPLDRRLTARAGRFATLPAYAELRLGDAGWTALHASQAATHVVHAFCSADCADEAALAAAAQAAGLALNDASVTAVTPGRRREAWTGNCVCVGGAACALDPVLDLDLHLVQLGIVHLLALFPAGQDHAAERAEYNRISASLFDRLRDFQAAIYALALPARRPAAAPDLLAHRLATFRARGMVAAMEDESFPDDQWRALLVGLGVTPESWPPALDATAPDHLKHGFRRILGFVRDKVLAQPSHDAYLADLGAREGA